MLRAFFIEVRLRVVDGLVSLAGLVEEINLLSFKLRAYFMIQLSTIVWAANQTGSIY